MGADELVFRGKHFRVYHEAVALDVGGTATYEYVWRRDGTRTLAVEGGRILLTREYRHELGDFDWRVPGGKLDPDELPEDGARREFREETGYTAESWVYLWSSTPDATVRYQRHFFLATELMAGEPDRDAGEDISTSWVDLDKARELALSGSIREEISALAILRACHAELLPSASAG